MKKRCIFTVILAACTLLLVTGCGKKEEEPAVEEAPAAPPAPIQNVTPADYVLTNAYIYTENDMLEIAEAIAVRDGKYVYVGEDDSKELHSLIGFDTEVYDMKGKVITPSFFSTIYEMNSWEEGTELSEEEAGQIIYGLNSYGVTGMTDAIIEDEAQIQMISKMDAEGMLGMYYSGAVKLESFEELENAIAKVRSYQGFYGTTHVKVNAISMIYDGTSEEGTSALLGGTAEDPEYHGERIMKLDKVKEVLKRCDEEKIDLYAYVNGDFSFRLFCNAVEEVQKEFERNLYCKVVLSHCELVDPEDAERPAELGITVSVPLLECDKKESPQAREYLGEERYNARFEYTAIAESSASLLCEGTIRPGEEFTVLNPYQGISNAMEQIQIEKLLNAYTIAAAKQLGVDAITGSIEVGKNADFNLYKKDFFNHTAEEMAKTVPMATVFEGRILYGSVE